MNLKGVFIGIYLFCKYLFWPQWGNKQKVEYNEDR